MTVYHVIGNVYFLASRAANANNIYDQIITKINDPKSVFSNEWNVNTCTKHVLPNGVTQLKFSLRLINSSDKELIRVATNSTDLLDPHYDNSFNWHVCEHDSNTTDYEPGGVADTFSFADTDFTNMVYGGVQSTNAISETLLLRQTPKSVFSVLVSAVSESFSVETNSEV